MNEIVITTAKRLPIGKFMGSLSNFSAPQLGSSVIDSVISESGISKNLIDEVIMGQVLTGGSGQNPARQASMLSDLPEKVSALTINQVCGSGLRSVMVACQSILSGQSEIVIAGGQESMSNAHHIINLRNGLKIEHACELSCACTTCHCIVREGFESLDEASEIEEDMLDKAWGLESTSRLSCQVFTNSKDLTVELPKYTINQVSEEG